MQDFKISKTVAKTRIEDWQGEQSLIKTALGTNPAKDSTVLGIEAFTFRLADLIELLNRIYLVNNPGETSWKMPLPTGNEQINAIRFYLGQKEVANPPNTLEPCLVALGVEDFAPTASPSSGGKDIYDLPTAPDDSSVSPAIYDFSYPCPTTCPEAGYGISDS